MPIDKICQHCNKGFSVPQRRHEKVKFCSRECGYASKRAKCTCAVCKKEFEYAISDALKPKQYCSNACRIIGSKGKPLIRKNSGITVKTCKICQSEFKVTKTRIDTAKYCSKKCQYIDVDFRKACSESQQAEKSWRWTGGIYKRGNGYVRQRRNIDGVTQSSVLHRNVIADAMILQCPEHPFLVEKGGIKVLSKDIEVHHIDRVRDNNDISNLLAVTKDAHYRIHHQNMKPNNWECWPPNPEKW